MFRNPTADLVVVLLIVLLIFGPKRLPGLGKQLGSGIREFKDSITGSDDDRGAEDQPSDARSQLTQSTPGPTPGATTERRPADPAGSERRS
jgi:sec-independent protein translocase protein TatA